jgi:uncharacterized membrane protein YedE/YeeE
MLLSISSPWPWYVAGPLIGLIVPLLLILGNKRFGVSSSLRHICAACFPADIPFFKYRWKSEAWNLFFVAGILLGGIVAADFLQGANSQVEPTLVQQMSGHGLNDFAGLMPKDLFSWPALFSVRGIVFTVIGGFLVGFGTRYAGGCTSGHCIMGLSNLQWPSLVATICFMAGGFIMSNLLLPYLLQL